jgi:N-acyl homoserine lactone hydrolase
LKFPLIPSVLNPNLFAMVWVVSSLPLTSCVITSVPIEVTSLGSSISAAELETLVDQPGPLDLQQVVAANWSGPLSGLLNLSNPKAVSAGLKDRQEPIQIYFYAISHPTRGNFLVDSGVSKETTRRDDDSLSRSFVGRQAGMDKLETSAETGQWIMNNLTKPPFAAFFTHIHLDHIMGISDLPKQTTLYIGPGENSYRDFQNIFVQGFTDRLIGADRRLMALEFPLQPSSESDIPIIDLFGDKSFFALHVPGHTPGSLAFVARTKKGSVLMLGDTCHTAFGWLNGVEPGSFTHDHALNRRNLNKLRELANRHPKMKVYLGHQAL